jgi:6-pyruvoyltetrahydropterin/6-carboxytetrahydropterin synthase
MTHITCTRRLEFDAGHRVVRHESKCRYVHGHRYVVEATFTAKALDEVGRVVDFGVIKEVLGGWLDDHMDHTTLLWKQEDQKLGDYLEQYTGQKIYYMSENPTAENIARHLLETICPQLFKDAAIRCTKITIHETPNCTAEAAL